MYYDYNTCYGVVAIEHVRKATEQVFSHAANDSAKNAAVIDHVLRILKTIEQVWGGLGGHRTCSVDHDDVAQTQIC